MVLCDCISFTNYLEFEMTENWPEKHASKHEIHQETQELVVGGLGSRGEYNVFSSTDNLETVFNAFRCIQCLNFSRIEDLMGRNTKCSLKGQIKIISILCKYSPPWTCPLSPSCTACSGEPPKSSHTAPVFGEPVFLGEEIKALFSQEIMVEMGVKKWCRCQGQWSLLVGKVGSWVCMERWRDLLRRQEALR